MLGLTLVAGLLAHEPIARAVGATAQAGALVDRVVMLLSVREHRTLGRLLSGAGPPYPSNGLRWHLPVLDGAASGVAGTLVPLLLGFLAAGLAAILGGFLGHHALPWCAAAMPRAGSTHQRPITSK